MLQGALLALPQVGLTLGNAVIATTEEHNALFPHRPVSVRTLALDHAVLNLVTALEEQRDQHHAEDDQPAGWFAWPEGRRLCASS